jgi:predicted nucleic acid-binding Zn ribbon protein
LQVSAFIYSCARVFINISYSKHGCDYKGYGLASRLPRLDLSAFANEKLEERLRPVVQQFCIVCQSPEQQTAEKENRLIFCSGGCSRAYHQHCHTPVITVNPATEPVRWYCSALCKENRKRNKVGMLLLLFIYLFIIVYTKAFSLSSR